MLPRRHIRIKVLQALYGFYRDEYADTVISLRNLNRSLERIYELYLYDISTLREILRAAEERIELNKSKLRPSQEDLNPNTKFIDNRILRLLKNNVALGKAIEENHISWAEYREHFKKLLTEIRQDDIFFEYMQGKMPGFEGEKKIVKYIYAKYICENEFLHHFYEDKYIHWADDLDAAQMMTTKTIKTLKDSSNPNHPLVKLFKDQSDEEFGQKLFKNVVANNEKYEKWISEKTRNWDTDRIAVVDILLMKMAIAELITFKEIPVKVTLNEYIELSKQYSTPKSANFINGVLDKLVSELQENGEVKKIGRGLM